MTTIEIISFILNFILGGTCIVTLTTLKATRSKAIADAKGAEIDNSEKLLKISNEYIVEPLTKKINGLERTIKKLEQALKKIADCPHADNCPVRNELQKHDNSNND